MQADYKLRCEWCNEFKRLTTHHIKNRLGERESVYVNGELKEVTARICRECHDEIERMYEFETRVVIDHGCKRENTLDGIRNNIYFRMGNIETRAKREETEYWLQKKMHKVHWKMKLDRSCHIGLYNTIERNRLPYRKLIMTLGIALNDIKVIKNRY